MHTFQYQVLARVDEFRLASGIAAPEDKHQVFLILAECLDGCIGKLLPAFALMARSLMGTNGKGGVEQQDSLLRPAGQIASGWHRSAEIHLNLLKYINQ